MDHGIGAIANSGLKPSASRDRFSAVRSGETPGSINGSVYYRARLPILVLAFRDNHDMAVPIQAGATFEAIGPAPDDRFTIVNVKGEEFLVFSSDLRHCETLGLPSEVQCV